MATQGIYNFKIPFLVSYISQFMTLFPGDIIATGTTPSGTGQRQWPPVFLKSRDVLDYGIPIWELPNKLAEILVFERSENLKGIKKLLRHALANVVYVI